MNGKSDPYLTLEEQDQLLLMGVMISDLSGAKRILDKFAFNSKISMANHFVHNRSDFQTLYLATSIVSLNEAGLKIYDAKDLDQFIEIVRVSSWESKDWVEFMSIKFAWLYFENSPIVREIQDTTISGEPIWIQSRAIIAPGYEHNWSRCTTIIQDITKQRFLLEQANKITKLELAVLLVNSL